MKILFVNPFGIGDILFTTPLIRPLKEKGNFIYYWCNERVADILEYNKAIEAIFPLSRGDFKRIFKESAGEAVKKGIGLIRQIKRERFDVVLDFSLDYRYSLLLRLLGIKKITGFDYKGRGRFLTDKIKIKGFNDRHMVDYYSMLLRSIDMEPKTHNRMELFVGDNENNWAQEMLRQNGIGSSDILIGIAPGGGASWGESAFQKHWPKEKYAYIADELTSKDRCKILLFGSDREVEICNFITERRKNSVLNLCGKTSIGQFAASLQQCKLLMTNDGGPLHMASALGVETVSVFGPVDEKVYGPYPFSKEHTIVKGDVECRPCYKNFRYPLCHKRECLDSIKPSAVLKAVRSKLI
jgi:lipopolysaccharide heptosyltransferase II